MRADFVSVKSLKTPSNKQTKKTKTDCLSATWRQAFTKWGWTKTHCSEWSQKTQSGTSCRRHSGVEGIEELPAAVFRKQDPIGRDGVLGHVSGSIKRHLTSNIKNMANTIVHQISFCSVKKKNKLNSSTQVFKRLSFKSEPTGHDISPTW